VSEHFSDPTPSSSSKPKAANLKPKEHGAYAILAIPMATSLVLTGWTVVGVAVVIASVAGFFTHEPLLVSLGHRGKRAARESPTAKRQAILLTGIMVAAGTTAFYLGSTSVQSSLVICVILALISFGVAIVGNHRSLFGQLWGVIGLSVPCVPVLLAGDVSVAQAVEVWGVWLIGFTATTMAVRGVIAAQKRGNRSIYWTTIMLLCVLVMALMFAGFRLPVVTLPMLAMSLYLMIAPPPARQLKRVGWTLVVGTVATATWMTLS
jgi:hypothetical protein